MYLIRGEKSIILSMEEMEEGSTRSSSNATGSSVARDTGGVYKPNII
jgi:hypothetical protein